MRVDVWFWRPSIGRALWKEAEDVLFDICNCWNCYQTLSYAFHQLFDHLGVGRHRLFIQEMIYVCLTERFLGIHLSTSMVNFYCKMLTPARSIQNIFKWGGAIYWPERNMFFRPTWKSNMVIGEIMWIFTTNWTMKYLMLVSFNEQSSANFFRIKEGI